MNTLRPYYLVFFFLALPFLFLQNTGCTKEYSFEGIDTVGMHPDTINIPLPVIKTFPECSLCHASDETSPGTWNFMTGNAFVCGAFTNSGFIGGLSKTDFTFFGPSACSVDTGIVVSAFLPVALDQDRFNIISDRAAFYYYDHNATHDIFVSRQTSVFTVTVESFIYVTGIATGTYAGFVFKPNGDTAYISNGRFNAKLQ